jgi:HD superfamily phosphohydrolase
MPSANAKKRRIVIDNIHGDIELTATEWEVVNTSTFQRLRSLKQLGMGHLVYPNATHTRFAHSLGVFKIMSRIVERLNNHQGGPSLSDEEQNNLRLAALLHDIGHYPYSHLMERVDWVKLTEEVVDGAKGKRKLPAEGSEYPDHESLGRHIIENQEDIREAIGGLDRAKVIGDLFSRTTATDQQLSKLIHSSLDMDRLDYLLRDSRAAGVPYGEIDLNYILNNIRISPSGVLGVEEKALAAAEHFLLARQFMHRSVYYHKTTYGFEEACRQLLRRMKDSGAFTIHKDGKEVLDRVAGHDLATFNDSYLDRLIQEAAQTSVDDTIRRLANCISSRRPPKLLAEVSGLQRRNEAHTSCSFFQEKCKDKLSALASKHDIPLGLFLCGGPKPIKIEERGSLLTPSEARSLQPEERDEIIKVFKSGHEEPVSILDVSDSMISLLSNHTFGIQRLYLVDHGISPKIITEIQREVRTWAR